MRYFIRTDIVAVKDLTMGLITLHPTVPESVGVIFLHSPIFSFSAHGVFPME